MKKHITLIDLNNFSYYPAMAVGLLSTYIKKSGFDLTTLIPLSQGIKSRKREKKEKLIDYLFSRFTHSDWLVPRIIIYYAKRNAFIYQLYTGKRKVYNFVKSTINYDTDLVLISCTTDNYSVCKKICGLLDKYNIPVIIGGPGFNSSKNVLQFIQLPSVKYVVGSEVDEYLGSLLKDYFDQGDITKYPGVNAYSNLNTKADQEYIYKNLDNLPLPDYSDFPWNNYPFKVIPYMTGRGCGWGKCNFCTDVMFVNGRTFRSQSSSKILNDLQKLTDQVDTNIINFFDIKLNSHVGVWNDLINNLPNIIQNPIWFCSVHVDNRINNGLDLETLKKAKKAGLTRISFGLETAAQRLLDHMKKGTTVEKLEQFVNDVYCAGISLRTTMFLGYIDEQFEDLKSTYEFLLRNHKCFDRIRVSRFQILEMSSLFKEMNYETRSRIFDNRLVQKNKGREYYRYKVKILKLCHQINSKGLKEDALKYDGVM